MSKMQTDPWITRPIVGKFKVLSGVHSEGALPGTYREDPGGVPLIQPRVYRTGEVVASRSDLLLHNPVYGQMKFEKVPDNTPDKYDAEERALAKDVKQTPVEESLESLTVPELHQLAKAEGIDLGDLSRKAEIISWMKESRGVPEG